VNAARAVGGAAVIGVTSGKGGVGKTSVVVNLAVALAAAGRRVGILDADFALGNVDVQLGLAPAWNLADVLRGERRLDEILISGPRGVRIVPSSSGLPELAALDQTQWQRLADVVEEFCRALDFVLIDTAAGISPNVIRPLGRCERILIVTSAEPCAVVDAYALVKVLSGARPEARLGVVVNGVRTASEADLVFRHLEITTRRFLGRQLDSYGSVPEDAAMKRAILDQRALVERSPEAAASRSFRLLAARLTADHPVGGQRLTLVRSGGPPVAGALGVPRCA
jgi:flagellar biosynthesis protein FlhG